MSFRRISILAAVALLAVTLAVGVARAQGGGTVADFTLKTAANADVALKSYAGNKAVVVVFLNPACAFSRLYQERLASLSSSYRGRGVQFLFINVPINLDAPGTAAPGEVELPTLTDASQQVSAPARRQQNRRGRGAGARRRRLRHSLPRRHRRQPAGGRQRAAALPQAGARQRAGRPPRRRGRQARRRLPD